MAMDTAQAAAYRDLSESADHSAETGAGEARHDAARCGPQRAAAWPDCCFRSETVVHPRTRRPWPSFRLSSTSWR